MSGNFGSCDELGLKGINMQLLLNVKPYHQASEQMQLGQKSQSPIGISRYQSLNTLCNDNFDKTTTPNHLNSTQFNGDSFASSITLPPYQPLSFRTNNNQQNDNYNNNCNNKDNGSKSYQISHLFKNFSSSQYQQESNILQTSEKIVKEQTQQPLLKKIGDSSGLGYNQDVFRSNIIQNKNDIIQFPFLDDKIFGSTRQLTNNMLEINLTCSKLNLFPQEICNMRQLERIKIDSNYINKLPEDISKLTELKQFSISDNKLFALPYSFSYLQNLISLDISKNNLDPFPSEVCLLKNLTIFLPLQFSQLEKLQELAIDWFKYTFPSMNCIQTDTRPIQILRQECKRLLALEKEEELQQKLKQIQELGQLEQYGKNTIQNLQSFNISRSNKITENKTIENKLGSENLLEIEEGIKLTGNSIIERQLGNYYKQNSQEQQQQVSDYLFSKQINNPLQSKLRKDFTLKQFLYLFSKDSNPYLLGKSDKRGRNIYHISALNQEISIIKAATLLQLNPESINHLDDENQSPLSLSLLEEKFISAKILLFFGADPLIGGGKLGSCLHIAVSKMDIELVSQILSKGVDTDSRDFEGNTPLHLIFSIYKKNQKKAQTIIELLIEKGINCNAKNFDNWSALHLAVKKMQTDAISWISSNQILRQKFNWDIQGGNSQLSLLHLASQLGFQDIIQILIERVDPHLLTKYNQAVRDIVQSNNLISKLLKKREIQLMEEHLSQLQSNQEKDDQPSQDQNYTSNQRMNSQGHLNSLYLLSNKSFPLEKYEQLIEEKLAAAKQINQNKENDILQQFDSLSSQKQSTNTFRKIAYSHCISSSNNNKIQQLDSSVYQIDNCQDSFYGLQNQGSSRESNKNRDLNNNFQVNDLFTNDLQNFISTLNLDTLNHQFDFDSYYQSKYGQDSAERKFLLIDQLSQPNSKKILTDGGQIQSSEILDTSEFKNKLWYGNSSSLKIKQSNLHPSARQVEENKDFQNSFEIIEDTDENIPEEHTNQTFHQFNINNYLYNHSNNYNHPLHKTEYYYQYIIKESINFLIDDRVNFTSKQQLILIFIRHVQEIKNIQKKDHHIQNDNSVTNFQLGKLNILGYSTNNKIEKQNTFDESEKRLQNTFKQHLSSSNKISQINEHEIQSIKQKILLEYLPLYLESVVKYNILRQKDYLINSLICELLAFINYDKVSSFLKDIGRDIIIQQNQSLSSLIFSKNITDIYQHLQYQKNLKKKTKSPLSSKLSSKSKHQTHSQQIKTTSLNIASTPTQSSAQVRIPKDDFINFNLELQQQLNNQQSQQFLQNPFKNINDQESSNQINLKYQIQIPDRLFSNKLAAQRAQNSTKNLRQNNEYNQQDQNINYSPRTLDLNSLNNSNNQTMIKYDIKSILTNPQQMEQSLTPSSITNITQKQSQYFQTYASEGTQIPVQNNCIQYDKKFNTPQNNPIIENNFIQPQQGFQTTSISSPSCKMNISPTYDFPLKTNVCSQINSNKSSNQDYLILEQINQDHTQSQDQIKQYLKLSQQNTPRQIQPNTKINLQTPQTQNYDKIISQDQLTQTLQYKSSQISLQKDNNKLQNQQKILNNNQERLNRQPRNATDKLNISSLIKDVQHIQLNTSQTPKQSTKTKSVSTERYRTSTNSFSIQQKLLFNRIISSKSPLTNTTTNTANIKKEDKQKQIIQISKNQQESKEQYNLQQQLQPNQQQSDLTKHSTKHLKVFINKKGDTLDSSFQDYKSSSLQRKSQLQTSTKLINNNNKTKTNSIINTNNNIKNNIVSLNNNNNNNINKEMKKINNINSHRIQNAISSNYYVSNQINSSTNKITSDKITSDKYMINTPIDSKLASCSSYIKQTKFVK